MPMKKKIRRVGIVVVILSAAVALQFALGDPYAESDEFFESCDDIHGEGEWVLGQQNESPSGPSYPDTELTCVAEESGSTPEVDQ